MKFLRKKMLHSFAVSATAAAMLMATVLAGPAGFSGSTAHAAQKKIYLLNGALSAVLGYGLRNLSKKISGERYFEFPGGISSSLKNRIVAEAAAAYKKDPNTKIALVGISAGAKAVAQIASALGSQGVPVAYLGLIEGGSVGAVKSNVATLDSFVCTGATCSGNSFSSNSAKRKSTIRLNTGHIDSSNDPKLHQRVISQINRM